MAPEQEMRDDPPRTSWRETSVLEKLLTGPKDDPSPEAPAPQDAT